MATVIKLNQFAPNVGPFSVYLDADGLTCWMFQWFAQGFVRANLSDGSTVFQGNINNTSTGGGLDSHESGSVMLIQDDQSHYYTTLNQVLYKAHVSPGSPVGNLWNGYMAIDATLSLATIQGVSTFDFEGWVNPIAPAADGNRYAFLITDSGIVVVNVATMTLVGAYPASGTYGSGANAWFSSCAFMDKNGDFWCVALEGSSDRGGADFIKWHPQDGATGGTLNVTKTHIAGSAWPLFSGSPTLSNGPDWGCYNASLHAAVLGNTVSQTTGALIVVSLTTLTPQIAFAADNHANSFTFNFDAAEAAFEVGVQPDGTLAIVGDPNTSGQQAGILNIFNPSTLTLKSATNITTTINAAFPGGVPLVTTGGFPTPHFPPTAMMKYSSTANALVTAYDFSGTGVLTAGPGWLVKGLFATGTTPSTTSLLSSEAPSFFEDEVTFSVSVTRTSGTGPTPTGTVTLVDSTGPTTLATITLNSSGAGTFTINSLAPGIHNITATYSGDSVYASSNITFIQQVIGVFLPSSILPGFALIGTFSPIGDSALIPQAQLFAIPQTTPANQSITLIWSTLNVAQVKITAPGGFSTGLISTAGTGAFVIGNGITITTFFTLATFDASGNPILVEGSPLTASTTVTVM